MTSTSAHQTPYQRTNGAAIEGILTLPSEDSCLCDLLFRFRKIPEWEDCMDGRLNLLPHQVYPLFQDRILSKIIRERDDAKFSMSLKWVSENIYIFSYTCWREWLTKAKMYVWYKEVMQGIWRDSKDLLVQSALIIHRN